MEQRQFWILLARKLAGEASLRDLYELEKAKIEYPDLQFSARLITDFWNKSEEIRKEPGGEEKFIQLWEQACERQYRKTGLKSKNKKNRFNGLNL